MQIAALIVALIAVYVVKAAVVARSYESLAAKDASFSWAAVRPEDEAMAASWATEEEPAARPSASLAGVRRMGRAGA